LDSEDNSEHDSVAEMRMEDDVDTPEGIDLHSVVHMESDSDDKEEEDMEEEDENDDDGKEPWTIGQGEMVNSSADDVDTIVDDQPIL
jgi:hypothetical protein